MNNMLEKRLLTHPRFAKSTLGRVGLTPGKGLGLRYLATTWLFLGTVFDFVFLIYDMI